MFDVFHFRAKGKMRNKWKLFFSTNYRFFYNRTTKFFLLVCVAFLEKQIQSVFMKVYLINCWQLFLLYVWTLNVKRNAPIINPYESFWNRVSGPHKTSERTIIILFHGKFKQHSVSACNFICLSITKLRYSRFNLFFFIFVSTNARGKTVFLSFEIFFHSLSTIVVKEA